MKYEQRERNLTSTLDIKKLLNHFSVSIVRIPCIIRAPAVLVLHDEAHSNRTG